MEGGYCVGAEGFGACAWFIKVGAEAETVVDWGKDEFGVLVQEDY